MKNLYVDLHLEEQLTGKMVYTSVIWDKSPMEQPVAFDVRYTGHRESDKQILENSLRYALHKFGLHNDKVKIHYSAPGTLSLDSLPLSESVKLHKVALRENLAAKAATKTLNG